MTGVWLQSVLNQQSSLSQSASSWNILDVGSCNLMEISSKMAAENSFGEAKNKAAILLQLKGHPRLKDNVIQSKPVKRLCRTHDIITVNGQFPGLTLEIHNGDTLVIKVQNSARYNITLHWHGIRQMHTPWADGPEYVRQCPIQ
ncbi:Multicopper oxidase, N-terminal [Dillenia turbinata]|uniref:Multicopper oxidase, N-terminal n=1 Tax=Dillenia turbinata TaxID=194707 RepID=A0AAN8WIP1_9MAGN